MKITEIYKNYKIMPSLQLHQLRVAAVATQVAEAALEELDLENIKVATLLHDMGNIIKFKLDLFPEFLQPEGLDYWEDVKQEFISKYGDEEHLATYKIAEELGINERSMQLLKSIGFSKAPLNLKSEDLAKLIVCYSDHRVAPSGVKSLEDRMQGGRKRFELNKNITDQDRENYINDFERMADAMRGIESKIFAKARIVPGDVTDESVSVIIAGLKEFDIS